MSIYFRETFQYADGSLFPGNGGWGVNAYGEGSPQVSGHKYLSNTPSPPGTANTDSGSVCTDANIPAAYNIPFSYTCTFEFYYDAANPFWSWHFFLGGGATDTNGGAMLFTGTFSASDPADTLNISCHNDSANRGSLQIAFNRSSTTAHKFRADSDGTNVRLFLDGTELVFPPGGGGAPIPWTAVGAQAHKLGFHDENGTTGNYTKIPLVQLTTQTISNLRTSDDGLTMLADLAVSGITPTSGSAGFTLRGSGNGRTISGWLISGTTMTFTLSGVLSSSDVLTVDHVTATSTLVDADSIALGDFTDRSITNNTTVDNVAPTVSNWRVSTDGTSPILGDLSESFCTPSPTYTGWTIGGTTAAVAAGTATIAGTTISVHYTGTIRPGETVLLSTVAPVASRVFSRLNGTMSSNTAPSPLVATGATDGGAAYAPWKAFDGTNSAWFTVAGMPQSLALDIGSALTVTGYKLTADSVGNTGGSNPKTWTMQGSNDGSSWITLDTQTLVANWADGETRSYVFSGGAVSYRYYRVNVTASYGGGALAIREFQLCVVAQGVFFDGASPPNAFVDITNVSVRNAIPRGNNASTLLLVVL